MAIERIKIPSNLFPEQAENIANAIVSRSRSGNSISLDFSRVTVLQPGAGPRVGNTLRVVREMGVELTIIVPSDPESGSPDIQVLRRGGLGAQISKHATTIRTRARKQTRILRKALKPTPAFADEFWFEGLGDWDPAASRSITDMKIVMSSYLENASAKPQTADPGVLDALARLVAETTWNVMDHSASVPLRSDEEVSSWISLRIIEKASLQLIAEGFQGEDKSTIYFDWFRQNDPMTTHFLEIVINDDGVGMAARQGLDKDIYTNAIDAERRAFSEALSDGGTVKLRAQDCFVDKKPGYGSAWIATALVKTSGYASVRSGRLLAYLDGTTYSSPVEAEFRLEDDSRSHIPGTLVHVLLPLGVPARTFGPLEQSRLF